MAPPTTLERLRVLTAVASAGTIAGAARSLGYAPSAVSQHLATLEREAAASLVERSNRGVTLTSAGRLLAGRAGDILDAVRTAIDDVNAATDGHPMSLSVAAFPTAITQILLPIREQIAPSIDLTIVDAESEHALSAVTSRAVEAAIIDGYAHQLHGGLRDLRSTLLLAEPVHLVTRRDRLRDRFDEYSDEAWVIAGPASPIGHAFRQRCQEAGFVPNVLLESDDHLIAFEAIRSCGAASLLPELALADLPEDLVIARQVDLRLQRRIEFVTRRSLSSNPAIAQLAEHLFDRFGGPGRGHHSTAG